MTPPLPRPGPEDAPHLAWNFDAGFRACTLVALVSALEATPGEVHAHLHPTETMDLEADVARIAAAFPQARIHVSPFDLDAYAHLPEGRLPLAARARLLLTDKHDGRLIYLDGDVLVRKDLSALWRTDLDGRCLAAVRTPGEEVALVKAERVGDRSSRKRAERIRAHGRRLDDLEMSSYFNSGVLLMDLTAIRAKGLDAAMRDIEGTARYTSRDQDWLNMVFRHETRLIDPTWNSGWGNPKTAKRYVPDTMRAAYAESREDPAIVHFTGKEKPWHAARPPVRVWMLQQPLQRRLRRRYWAEWQAAKARTEAILGRKLAP
jgi:lipopolysaccharide biosynthesis glycosyltransferase